MFSVGEMYFFHKKAISENTAENTSYLPKVGLSFKQKGKPLNARKTRKKGSAGTFISVFSVVISMKRVFLCLAVFSMGIVIKSVLNLCVDYNKRIRKFVYIPFLAILHS
jgi:hypothetical protein